LSKLRVSKYKNAEKELPIELVLTVWVRSSALFSSSSNSKADIAPASVSAHGGDVPVFSKSSTAADDNSAEHDGDSNTTTLKSSASGTATTFEKNDDDGERE